MPQFTVIANTSSHVLYINNGNMTAIKLFAELVNGNPNEYTVKRLQVSSQEFKERLQLFDNIGERFYKMKKFFNQIPTGQHYLFLPGCIKDQIQIYLHTKRLSTLDKVPLQSTNLERISSYLYDHYEVQIFNGDGRHNIGEYNKSEQFAASVNEFLTFRRYALLPDKGKVTREEADKKAEEEYRLFDPTQCIDSDFDKEIRGLFDVK